MPLIQPISTKPAEPPVSSSSRPGTSKSQTAPLNKSLSSAPAIPAILKGDPLFSIMIEASLDLICSQVICCAVFYCAALHHIILYCSVLYCTVLNWTVLCCTVLYSAFIYHVSLNYVVLCCAILYHIVMYSTKLSVLWRTEMRLNVLCCSAPHWCSILSVSLLKLPA